MTTRSPYELVNGQAYATTAAELAPYNITAHEAMCKEGDGSPCRECGGKILLSFGVMRRFKRVRDAHGGPITINSGYRCVAHQARLYAEASQAEKDADLIAAPGHSPHNFGEAIDTLTPEGFASPVAWGNFCLEVNKGDLRVGCLSYPWGAHLDTMFLLDPARGKGILW